MDNELSKTDSRLVKVLKALSIGLLEFITYVIVFIVGALAGILFMLFMKW
jgi:hypothetical protein